MIGRPSGGIRAELGSLAVPFAALFVLSGAAGLIYQTVWSRMLVTVFGVTAFAVSTVLVSFMGGMALGAALLGHRADRARRPLRMFAMLEGGIGLYALLLPLLLRAVDAMYTLLFPALPDVFVVRSVVRFVFCLALLLPPTILMGGTLPALGQGLLRRKERLGFGIGLLYFVNTLGAAVGCYLAGFLLLPHLGLTRTTAVAFVLNATVAGTAFWLDRTRGGEEAEATLEASAAGTGTVPDTATRPDAWPLWVAFGSGLCGLAFEVVWFRVLVLVFGSTVYSFSAMLSVFLLGIAVGALIVGRVVDRFAHPVRLLVLTQGAIALFALAGSAAVNLMPESYLRLLLVFGIDFAGMNRSKLLMSFVTLLPAALAFGATFPVVMRLAAGRGAGTGTMIGRVYAWNTAGAILGSFATGFVLLPMVGAERTLQLVIALALALAFGSLLAEAGPRPAAWTAGAGAGLATIAMLALLTPRWDRTLLGVGVYFDPQQFLGDSGRPSVQGVLADYDLTTFTEGYNETIISYRSPKGKFITVNGSTTASDHFEDMFSQRMLGHLPMALHPGPVRKACIIGLGAGVTAGAIGLYEAGAVEGIELEKGVFVASRFFGAENHHLLDNPRLRVRIDDGRNFLKMTAERFDVISSAPNFPSLTGSGSLYSRDFFLLARDRLTPGGTMCQFAPVWRMTPGDVKTIVASFGDVFPHVRVFSTGLSLVMLGRMEAFPPVDFAEVERRVGREEVASSLRGIGIRGPVELLSFYRFDEEELHRYVAGAARNTDDRPRTEFFAPRGVFANTVGVNQAELARYTPSVAERLRRLGLPESIASSFRALASACDATAEGQIAMFAGQRASAMEILRPVADSGARYARYLVADMASKEGTALQRHGRIEEAAASFELALAYEPDNGDVLSNLGYLEIFRKNPDRADALLSRAISLFPRSGGALYRMGALRQSQGRDADAEALYRQAIEVQPRLAKPYVLLADILLKRGDARGACDAFDRAIRLGDATEAVADGRRQARAALHSGKARPAAP